MMGYGNELMVGGNIMDTNKYKYCEPKSESLNYTHII